MLPSGATYYLAVFLLVMLAATDDQCLDEFTDKW